MLFMSSIIPVIAQLIVMGILVVFLVKMLNWRVRNFNYQCQICGAIFTIPLSVEIISFHIMGRKYVKCPHCGQWSWVTPIPKE